MTLGAEFAASEPARVTGVEPIDKDPKEYIDRHVRGGD
jgi:hypothetical protein